MPLVYHYHLATYEYIGSTQARLDSLESDKQGHAVYSLPANATFTAPPADIPDGYIAKWDQSADGWMSIQDNRGKTVYNTKDKSPLKISNLGDIPGGYTTDVPGEYDTWDGESWQENEDIKHNACITRLRTARDARLAATDWLCLRHRDEQAATATTTLTADEYTDLLVYRRTLRDLPATTEDIEHPIWPTLPDCIA